MHLLHLYQKVMREASDDPKHHEDFSYFKLMSIDKCFFVVGFCLECFFKSKPNYSKVSSLTLKRFIQKLIANNQ